MTRRTGFNEAQNTRSTKHQAPSLAFGAYFLLGTFIVLLFVRLVVDWIQMFARSWVPRGPVLVVLEGVYTITDPE